MKFLVLLAVSLMSISSFAGAGDLVEDQSLFNSIRERYDGLWFADERSDDFFAENLKDGSILLELADNTAVLAFANLPLAQESIKYIPAIPGGSYHNYFNRLGASMSCGFYSGDLKRDPLAKFKCRFSVDAEGNVFPFTDRSESTSYGNKEWETDNRDFHWRRLNEMKNSVSVSSYRPGPRTQETVRPGNASVYVVVYGTIADAIYDKLNVAETRSTIKFHIGEPRMITNIRKTGKQMWCRKIENRPNSTFCNITFDYAGEALPGTED